MAATAALCFALLFNSFLCLWWAAAYYLTPPPDLRWLSNVYLHTSLQFSYQAGSFTLLVKCVTGCVSRNWQNPELFMVAVPNVLLGSAFTADRLSIRVWLTYCFETSAQIRVGDPWFMGHQCWPICFYNILSMFYHQKSFLGTGVCNWLEVMHCSPSLREATTFLLLLFNQFVKMRYIMWLWCLKNQRDRIMCLKLAMKQKAKKPECTIC